MHAWGDFLRACMRNCVRLGTQICGPHRPWLDTPPLLQPHGSIWGRCQHRGDIWFWLQVLQKVAEAQQNWREGDADYAWKCEPHQLLVSQPWTRKEGRGRWWDFPEVAERTAEAAVDQRWEPRGGTSLVVQWVRIHLPMQVPSLGKELRSSLSHSN